MKKKAVIINGFGGVGKDTFIEMVHYKARFMHNTLVSTYSSVDKVKQAAITLGWDGKSKTEKDRRFLHELKKLVTA